MAASLAVRISLDRSDLSVSRPLRCSSAACLGTILMATYRLRVASLVPGINRKEHHHPGREREKKEEKEKKKKKSSTTHLLSGLHVLCDFDLPHASSPDSLSQSPVARGGRNGRSTPRLGGIGGDWRSGWHRSLSCYGASRSHVDTFARIALSRGVSVMRSVPVDTRRPLLGAVPGRITAGRRRTSNVGGLEIPTSYVVESRRVRGGATVIGTRPRVRAMVM